jgi:ABC-type antimicrobial peptide transport system permease subunit
LAALGLLGFGLALVGLYGVMLYVVGLRSAEFGVRKVLGATEWQIYRVVLRDACRMLAIGVGAVVPLALALSFLINWAVVGVTLLAPVTYLILPACLALAGVIASWWPARRAARVEPLAALRQL